MSLPPEIQHLSWSSVGTYSACPSCWRASYLDRAPRRVSPSLVIGASLHGALAALRQGASPDDAVGAAETEAGRTLQGEDRFGELGPADPMLDLGSKFASWSAVEDNWKALLPSLAAVREAEADCEVLAVEQPLDFTGLFSVPFVGYVDVLLQREGRRIVKDFKTSGRDELAPPTWRQLAVYAMAAGTDVVGADHLVTLKTPRLHVWTDEGYSGVIPPELFTSVAEQVEWVADQIGAGNFPVGSGGPFGHSTPHAGPVFYSVNLAPDLQVA